MEIFLPSSARQHWVYTRNETSSQRMETEAPITMVMAIGDRTNLQKKEYAHAEAQRYKQRLSSFSLEQILSIEVAVLDFMSFVDYGDGLSLPAEVGVARSSLGKLELESYQVYGSIPHIPYRVQRTGFASDAKESCERVHGIDILDQRSCKEDLDQLCRELKSEVEGCTLLLSRSEDLSRVLGSWYWLQDTVPAGQQLNNIGVITIEDFLVLTMSRLHQISRVPEGGVPTFSQFTTLLTRSADDLNPQFRCEYHNTVENAWNKPGCARKNVMKYLKTISDCLSPPINDCRGNSQTVMSVSSPLLAPQTGGMEMYDRPKSGGNFPRSGEESVHSSGYSSSSSSSSSSLPAHLSPPGSSVSTSVRPKGRGRFRRSPNSTTSGNSGSTTTTSSSRTTNNSSKKDNPLGLLSPDFFKVSQSEDSFPTRSSSSSSERQQNISPQPTSLPPPPEVSAQEIPEVPVPPRRPGRSFSARKDCSSNKPEFSSLPSSGVTNLPLSSGPVPTGPSNNVNGLRSTPEEGQFPRRPLSFNNRKKEVFEDSTKTYDTLKKGSLGTQQRVERSGTSTSPVIAAGLANSTSAELANSTTAGLANSTTSGLANSTSAGPAYSASTGLANSTSAGLANSTTAGHPNSTSAGLANSTSAGLANSISAELANSTSAGLANSTSAGLANSTSAGLANSTSAGLANSTSAGLANSTSAGLVNSTSTGLANSTSAGLAYSASAGLETSDAMKVALALASASNSALNLTNFTPGPSAGYSAEPHPAFLQAFSTTESASHNSHPPGFDPVPKYRTVPSGFVLAPLPSRGAHVLNESISSEESSGGEQVENKSVKKRGRR